MRITARPSISVVGLKANQQNVVNESCGTKARLAFVDSRKRPRNLPQTDHVILMIKFIKHHWTRTSLGNNDRSRVHLHRGGVSSLVKEIQAICA